MCTMLQDLQESLAITALATSELDPIVVQMRVNPCIVTAGQDLQENLAIAALATAELDLHHLLPVSI